MKLRDQMPELDGATAWLNSKQLERKDIIGRKPTLIHFWSVSCDSCKRDMSNVNIFRDTYSDTLNIIAVHMPRSEEDINLDQIQGVANEQGISQPIIVDNEYALTNAFRVRYVPAYYLFDHEGKLRYYQSGNSGGINILRKRINRVLDRTI
ncbi:redoxin domain-containing protein [Virgibacillus sp. NKC19-3]|uniref:redoxin domain-containing protein n=1 Tax=Virgibacillus saliphilus TaxID=2831674 RepID=UPI001C9AEDF8|nr:redoxin domain-containing protein [Virgibacillus sp. NKC19-3]MBY7143786.1 redoxin domain-containing protein [Virgibacillus sp. NKC19-3]